MAQLDKIDSNVTGLRYAEEESYKTLPTTPDWIPMEPNSYGDFGGSIVTTPRNPINPSRQKKKGTTTDLEAGAAWENDLTQSNMQDLLQGFFFADLRRKAEFGGSSEITAVTALGDDYAGTGIEDNSLVNDLLFATGFTNAANNGLKTVDSVAGPDLLAVAEALVDETPGALAKVVTVGHVAAGDDLGVTAGAAYPTLTSTILDFTTLGLIPGEWIFIGGDAASNQFVTAGNNGFKRVRSITANAITLDKGAAMTTEVLVGGEAIQLFFGRVLKNEIGTLIKRRTYHMERTLGAPDDAAPSDIQAEYVKGCVPNEFSLNIPSADKVMANLSFVGADVENVDAATALKTGNRPALVESDAFNTSSDFSRVKMAVHSLTDEAPTPLFAFVQDITLNLTNNVSGNKAVGVLGNFEATAGTFEVGGDITAYFADVQALDAVRNNSNVTLDVHMVKSNSGISLDLPLFSLGDGRPAVAQDEAITLPLGVDAATAALIDTDLDYTLLMMFWDYLPDAADV